MAGSLEQLDRQRDTLQGIRGIVRTMKTLSAINALPYERAARSIERYRETVLDGLHAFVCERAASGRGPHASAAAVAGRRSMPVLIALGSDHGLCGNYNERVAAEAALNPEADRSRRLCVGAQMADALVGEGLDPEVVLLPPANADGLGRLAGDLVTRLDALDRHEGFDGLTVSLVFTRRAAHGHQRPVSQPLLPVDQALLERLRRTPWASRSLPQRTLPSATLFAALVREYLFATVFAAAAEALVTENAARLARMQQAARSVDERLDEVAMRRRTERQRVITTELLDVVTGFEALRSRRRDDR